MGTFHKMSAKYMPLYVRSSSSATTIGKMRTSSEQRSADVKMKIIGIIAFLCVLFFWFVVWLGGGFSARNEPPKQPDQAYQAIDAPKKYLAPVNTALTLGFNRLGTFIHDFREEIVAIGTLFIAAFTIILAFATAFLYEATRDLVKGAEDTAQKQLRAYVFVDKSSIVLDGNTLKGVLDLKNAGQTPAYDLVIKSRLETEEAGKPFNPRPFNVVELSRAILGPQMVANPRADLTVPAENTVAIPAFKEGRSVIYFIGQAEYRDAFERTWVLDIRLKSHIFDGARWTLQPTEQGNRETQKK
jgi:hypothetical protein